MAKKMKTHSAKSTLKIPSIKYLSAKELRNSGILQEVNRLFFHRIGLALELTIPSGKLRLWDYRKDAEGILFGKGLIDKRKIASVRQMFADKMERRIMESDCDASGIQVPDSVDPVEGMTALTKTKPPRRKFRPSKKPKRKYRSGF